MIIRPNESLSIFLEILFEQYLVEFCANPCLGIKLSWNIKWSLESDTRHAFKWSRQVKFEFWVLDGWVLLGGWVVLETWKSWKWNWECLSTFCQLLDLEAWKQFTCLLQNHLCKSWNNFYLLKKHLWKSWKNAVFTRSQMVKVSRKTQAIRKAE